jgi:predicted RNA-binding protein YlxR (DUF448 family)
MRTCVVCRQIRPKRELKRIVHSEGQGVSLDPAGKAPGRGAYLCDRRACWEQAARTDIVAKALNMTMSADDRALLMAHGQTLPEKELPDM